MLNFKQEIQQNCYPQQFPLMKLIELPSLAFEERLIQEIEGNPLLEINTKINTKKISYIKDIILNYDYIIKSNHFIPKIKRDHNIYYFLKSQLFNFKLTNEEFTVANFILDNLDEEGYLRRNYYELINDISFIRKQRLDKHKIEKLIKIVQNLEPYGIGARNLRECLSIQLKQKPISQNILIAKLIIKDNFDFLCKKQYKKIKNILNLNNYELYNALNEIKHLNPKPGKIYEEVSTLELLQIVPDFFLRIEEGCFELYLNNSNARELYIKSSYIKLLRNNQNKYFPPITNILYLNNKFEKAQCFIDAIKQRKKTLLFTIKEILIFQKEYFLSGKKQKIRPMTLKEIAKQLHMEITTVSRVVNKKYIETPYGTFLIKKLFSEKIFHTFGEEISNIEVKYIISNLIDKENYKNPFTDEKISLIFKKKGYNIARRTITKYREFLHIPISRKRRSIE